MKELTKKELSEILHKPGIPVGEGEQFLDKAGEYPKIAYWEYIWDDDMASGDGYETVVTYQVSFVSRIPRDRKLRELRQAFVDSGMHPRIYHEYVKSENGPGEFHSYFNVDVTEDLNV